MSTRILQVKHTFPFIQMLQQHSEVEKETHFLNQLYNNQTEIFSKIIYPTPTGSGWCLVVFWLKDEKPTRAEIITLLENAKNNPLLDTEENINWIAEEIDWEEE